MQLTRELLLLLVGLATGGLITAALVRLIVPAWWRRYDRLEEQRYMRRPR
jgi:hypothetical protein